MHNKSGRGLEVSGGSTITFAGNYVDNLDGYSDLYIASEHEWNTQSVDHITVSGNTFVDGGPDQGTVILYNSVPGSTITAITIKGNQFVNPKLNAVQLAGSGRETGILLQDNTDYSTAQFSSSGNPNASVKEAGDRLLVPTAYKTPVARGGSGCNFAGCV